MQTPRETNAGKERSKDRMSAKLSLDTLTEEIMSLWENRTRDEVHSAGDILRPALRNGLPRFLGLLAHALSEEESRGLLQEGSELMRVHAGDRARETGYGPDQIIQELKVLREIVTSSLEEKLRLSAQDYETIQKTFDQAIQEALMEFFLVHATLREQFMATLSHDLRNPIGVAKMGAQAIQDIAYEIQDVGIRTDILRITSRIINNTRRADRMIQDLLDASALRLGEKIPVEIRECDLFRIAHEVISEIDEREQSRIHISGSSIKGFWDCEGLRRSIENLVMNAIKYGSKDSQITVKVTRVDGRAQLSVHNEGNPIPESEQKLLFRTFRRGKSAKESGLQGWGIGLALVRAVAESLGGSVRVESSQGTGTTFTIDLPQDSRVFQEPQGKVH